jgi:phytoene dehydrogenase-like protein
MNRWEVGGYRLDTGPSLVTLPWAFDELFAAAGERREDHVRFLPVEPLADYTFADGTRFTHTTVLPAWLDTVRRLEGGSADGFLRFLALGARLYEVSRATFLRRSPFEPAPPPPPRVLREVPWGLGFANYDAVVGRFFRSPALRQMFGRYPTYVGSSPYASPSTLGVIAYLEYVFGAWHIAGGLHELVVALVRLLEARGVEVRTGARVERIAQRDGRACGVELADGGRVGADAVVMDGDASRLPALLGVPGAAPLPERERSLSGFVQLYALRRRLEGRAHHSVFFSADYPAEFRALLRPANRARRPRGLYLVGGSTHPGGGTPTVLMSAAIVDGLIRRHEEGGG